MLDTTEGAVNTVVHEGPGFRLGYFECPPHDPRWDDVNWIGPTVHVAFPMRSVVIRQPSFEVLTDPNIAVFYEAGQTFTREIADPRGDRCTYVDIDGDLIEEIGTSTIDGPIPVDGRTYVAQWSCVRSLVAGAEVDRLALDDLFLRLLARVLETAPRSDRVPSSQKELVASTREVLSEGFTQPLTLDQLAREVHSSPFHLSRTFRRVTGVALHSYITELRLRESLERVWDSTIPLDRVACDLGFSSHSHFTARFRRSFGVMPSALRKREISVADLSRATTEDP